MARFGLAFVVLALFGSSCSRDSELARVTAAARRGDAEAQYHLGCFLSSNTPGRVPADNVAACFWLSLAAAEGHQESEELLNTLKARLTTAQQEEVKRRVDLWKEPHTNQK